jgi:hypothetical protein
MTTVPETPVTETLDTDESRREFLTKFASGVVAGLVVLAAPPEQATDLVPLFDLPPAVAGKDPTVYPVLMQWWLEKVLMIAQLVPMISFR